MKRAWIAGGVLIVLLIAAWANSWFIRSFTASLSDTLAQAETLAESGDWDQAGQLTQEAHQRWDSTSTYLCTVLRHADTDQVDISFHQVLEFLERQEDGEYSSANAALMSQIQLLAEMEQLTLKNLL